MGFLYGLLCGDSLYGCGWLDMVFHLVALVVLCWWLGIWLQHVMSILYGIYVMHVGVGSERWLRRHGGERRQQLPGVSIIKPLTGVDPNLEENLASFFELDYPGEFELLFCLHSEHDPAIALVHTLQARYPRVAVRLLTSERHVGINPKINNMQQGYEVARFDYMLISDCNLRARRDTLESLMRSLLADERCVCVHQIPFVAHSPPALAETQATRSSWLRPQGFINALQLVYFGSAHARAYWSANMMGINCLSGMSCLFRRSTLVELGGLARFGNFLAEDFFMGRAIKAHGYTTRVAAQPCWQNLGNPTLSTFEDRICRWYRLRIMMMPHMTVLEFFSECFPLGVFAAWALSYVFYVSAAATFFCHVLAWYLLDYSLICVLSSCPDVMPPHSSASSPSTSAGCPVSASASSTSISASAADADAEAQSDALLATAGCSSNANAGAVPVISSAIASGPHAMARVSHTRAASCKWPVSSEQSLYPAPASPPPSTSAQPALETLCELEAPRAAPPVPVLNRGTSSATGSMSPESREGAMFRHSRAPSKSITSNPNTPPADSASAVINFENFASSPPPPPPNEQPNIAATAFALARGLLESAAPNIGSGSAQQSKAARSLSPSPMRSQTSSFVNADACSGATASVTGDETRLQLLPERERERDGECDSESGSSPASRSARSQPSFPFSNLEIFVAWLFREIIAVPLEVRGLRMRSIRWRHTLFVVHLWGQTTATSIDADSKTKPGAPNANAKIELPPEELVGSGCPCSSLFSFVCCPHRTLAYLCSRRSCYCCSLHSRSRSRCLTLSRCSLHSRKPLLNL